MGCALVGSDTAPVHEFLTDGQTALLVPFHDPARIAQAILRLLSDKALALRLRRAARSYAEQTLCLKTYLAEYEALMAKLIAHHHGAHGARKATRPHVAAKSKVAATKPLKKRA